MENAMESEQRESKLPEHLRVMYREAALTSFKQTFDAIEGIAQGKESGWKYATESHKNGIPTETARGQLEKIVRTKRATPAYRGAYVEAAMQAFDKRRTQLAGPWGWRYLVGF